MQLNVKNDEAYELARRLAELNGESLTEAVSTALRERLERRDQELTAQRQTAEERFRDIMAIAERFDDLPVYDDREPDEIIGYDENGLPS